MSVSGLLIVDKPAGPTSHDVVARARRVLDDSRIGHTGTLDPTASGVLPLVVGRATRLARFLSSAGKTYEAAIRLGMATDTYDSTGVPIVPPYGGALPDRETIDRTLDEFRGTFLQQPPAYSAKKIGGQRSHRLARAASRESAAARQPEKRPARLPEPVTVSATVDLLDLQSELLTVRVTCSAGFYIRSLAHDLGARLGTGAHLAALRRTRAGDATISDAVPLERLLGPGGREAALARLVPLAKMLPALEAVRLTAEGVRRAGHGQDLGPADILGAAPAGMGTANSGVRMHRIDLVTSAAPTGLRLLGPSGELVGVAEQAASGLLHPCVVLV